MAVTVVIATGNEHKLEEFRALLAGSSFEIVAPKQLGLALDVAETGQTYAENAALKARAYAEAAGMPALADDSGLEVDALGGAPGVFSARFGGAALDDAGRVTLLLERLRAAEPAARTAHFHCVLAVATPDGGIWRAAGRCDGTVARAPRGKNGFGYDPIFEVAGTDRTMAELSADEKHRVSHRARAVAALVAGLDPRALGTRAGT